jgi:integrase
VGLAKKLIRNVRKQLNKYRARKRRSETSSDARRDLGRSLRKLARNAEPGTPAAIVMLVYWVVELLRRRAWKPHYLKPASIRRYLNALAPRFIAFAHNVDLAECGDDDIGDLYASMLVPMKDRERFDPSFVADRLIGFHRFAERKWGLEAPDWSEIVAEGSPVGGAPGLILEPEYLRALAEIVPEPAHAGRRELCSGMLLLLAYRFGLRGGEAFELRRDDWQDSGATPVVVVRRKRRLKRPWSQRQVPLLTALTPHETELVSRWLATWDAIALGNGDVPLFAMDQGGRRDSRRVLCA